MPGPFRAEPLEPFPIRVFAHVDAHAPSRSLHFVTSARGRPPATTRVACARATSPFVPSPVLQEHVLIPETVDGAVWRYCREHPKLPHFHGQLEFLVVKRGAAVERVGGSLHRVYARQLIWHLPSLAHELVWASADLDLRVIHLEPDLVSPPGSVIGEAVHRRTSTTSSAERNCFAGWMRTLSRYAAGRPVVELKERDFHSILEGCDSTSDQMPSFRGATGVEGRRLGDGDRATGRLQTALHSAWRATHTDHDDLRANSLVELASCRLQEDPSLARSELCRELCVSAGYLSRSFRAELGVSFHEQRARIRIAHFLAHAVRNRLNWLDAALRSGFGSYSQLHRIFGNLVGMSPRAYLLKGGRNRRALVPA
jgi:AraC-like DNA-binding protein